MIGGRPKLTRKEGSAVRHAVWERCGGRCENCGIAMIEEAGSWSSMHAAHVISRGRGGEFSESNLRGLCIACHLVGQHNPKSVPAKA